MADFVETRRLASTLQQLTPDTANLGGYRKGEIVSFETGPPATCTITLSGDSTEIPNIAYLDGYTPNVGDTVILGKQGGSLLILGTTEHSGSGTAMVPTLLIKRAAAQTISNNTDTAVSFDTQVANLGGPSSWWSVSTPNHIVCPWAGLYRLTVTLAWTKNITGRRAIHVNKGSTISTSNFELGDSITPSDATESSQYNHIDEVISVASAGQIYQMASWQNSGANLDLVGSFSQAPARCSFTYLGEP